jgi:hypothetical protein
VQLEKLDLLDLKARQAKLDLLGLRVRLDLQVPKAKSVQLAQQVQTLYGISKEYITATPSM